MPGNVCLYPADLATADPLLELAAADPARVAIDVEGDSFYRYGERLCLIQAAYCGRVRIYDPGAGDLAPWLENLAARELIFHGVDFDLRLLHGRYGFVPGRVFDTMLAARFLNLLKFGLSDLLDRYFGVVLNKKHQRADWCMRPIQAEMLEYARLDVERLEELAQKLAGELDSLGRRAWHQEECDIVVARTIENQRREADPDAWRVKGSGALSRRELGFLRELAAARDAIARDLDRALFRVLSAEDLVRMSKLASEAPETAIRRFPRPLPGYLRERLEAAMSNAAALPANQFPERPAPGRRAPPWVEKEVLRWTKRRDSLAREVNLDPGFLASRTMLARLAEARADSRDEIGAIFGCRWRTELFLSSP